MRGGGQPITFHVGPGAEPTGDPRSWGDSKVGISWRRGVGGREDTELLSNTWGAEGGGRFGGRGWGGRRWPTAQGSGLDWHWNPKLTPWPLNMVSRCSALYFFSSSRGPGNPGTPAVCRRELRTPEFG